MGLTAGTTYHYKVAAINSAGAGADSGEAAATTATAVTVPGAPTSLSATATGATHIDLNWTAPAMDRRRARHRLQHPGLDQRRRRL